VAFLSQTSLTSLDPARFEEVRRDAVSGVRVNWFSIPARLRDRLVVAYSGGGFPETEVLGLDADGELEPYAVEVRLSAGSPAPGDGAREELLSAKAAEAAEDDVS